VSLPGGIQVSADELFLHRGRELRVVDQLRFDGHSDRARLVTVVENGLRQVDAGTATGVFDPLNSDLPIDDAAAR
jgi:hypothetical protein